MTKLHNASAEKPENAPAYDAHGAMTRRAALGTGLVAVVALAIPTLAAAEEDDVDEDEKLRRISVDANAQVAAVPDVADVSFTVEAAGEDAAEVQNDASRIAEDARAAIVDAGVEESAIKISTMSVSPHYDYGNDRLFGSSTPRITGYTVRIPLEVTGIGTDLVGAVIAAAAGAGVNRVGGVSYTCSNYDDLYDEALAQACDRAAHKAEIAATALGYEIAGIEYANLGYENQTYKASPTVAYGSAYAMEDAYYEEDVAEVSFDPGTVEIYANVNIDFLAKKVV